MLALFILSKFSLFNKMALSTIIRLGRKGVGEEGGGSKTAFSYILFYNFLVTNANFMKVIWD